jgi:hypothetical protein
MHLFMQIFHLRYFLFPLWELAGVIFDFYDVIDVQCGSMFLPFAPTDGLYLSENFTVSSDSSVFSSFDDSNHVHIVLAAQTRSHTCVHTLVHTRVHTQVCSHTLVFAAA